MKKDLVEMIFILDKSGSMAGLETDTIGGFNSMIKQQKQLDKPALVTTVLFNHQLEVLYEDLTLNEISIMTSKDYYVSGMTALLDAIGITIAKIKNKHRYLSEEQLPEKTLIVITTDGMENSSQEFDYQKVRQLVSEQKQKGWEFLFLGANIDAESVAERYGIGKENAVRYHSDKKGTELNFMAMSNAVHDLRTKKHIEKNWNAEIKADYQSRKKGS